MIYLLRFADIAKINLEQACIEKIKKNKKKYPIKLSKGISVKYNKLKKKDLINEKKSKKVGKTIKSIEEEFKKKKGENKWQ